MSLSFPNPSRSYDATGSRIRFWGHDGAAEVSFFLEEDVILRFDPRTERDEASLLKSFDHYRDRIMEVAARVYARTRKRSYSLATSDF